VQKVVVLILVFQGGKNNMPDIDTIEARGLENKNRKMKEET